MHAGKRLFEGCRLCEGRGVVCAGDTDEANFPCPHCNCWCSLCLEQPLDWRNGRPLMASLLAAVRRTNAELELFEGFLCDFHCGAFSRYALITPAMIGRLKPGDPYILVQNLLIATHAFVVPYGYWEAQNWQELEAGAFAAVAAQRHSRYGWDGFYVCPPDLAARAVPPHGLRWQVGEVLERRVLAGGARLTTWAVSEGTSAVGHDV